MQSKIASFLFLTALLFPPPQTVAILTERDARGFISAHCGLCHGISLSGECLAGSCQSGPSHAITRRAWDFVVPWMRAMGCAMTDTEQSTVTAFLMGRFGREYPVRWERSGAVSGGWNVVALRAFHSRLYAGIEGNGTVSELEEGDQWRPVLTTSNYTVYGLIPFQEALYAATNDPAAEVWMTQDGREWKRTALLPDEKGITSLGLFGGLLYAGTTRGSLYRTADGLRWTRVEGLIPAGERRFGNWIRFILSWDEKLFVGIEDGGVYRSDDGTHFRPAGRTGQGPEGGGFPGGARGATLFNGALWVGATRGGEIWRLDSPEGKPIRVFQRDPNGPEGYVGSMAVFEGLLYASVGGSVFRTADGQKWEEVGQLTPFTVEAMTPFDHQLYAGTTLPPNAWVYRTAGTGRSPRLPEVQKRIPS